ncbi:NAD(P)-dependent oxidoreductase [Cryobacterium sp. TMS1-20-1]|uniref:NAD-dependent epimerase/dehydratase family protein n=1 Tax=Cryobacterium sp. TMS1-20-1 TaxID=1259223 RepID=UPI00141B4CC5|nr:NAD-dependent epimerase/dehydratase family protein [Cryobacterium sp. TMS1-20-1]
MTETNEAARRVLITGGLGFIGTKVIERLRPNDDIIVVDNLHPQVHLDRTAVDLLPPKVTFIEGDVTDFATMRAVASHKPTIVLHLAAETGTGQSLLESRRHANVNVNGTATLLDAMSAESWVPERFVLTSSRAVYGEGKWTSSETGEAHYAEPRSGERLQNRLWNPTGPEGEELDAPVANKIGDVDARPTNVYAATKLAQENMAHAWCTSFGVPLSILRLQNVYGSGQAIKNPYTGVLTFMARQALTGAPINVYEDGGIVRDFVNVMDVADAIVASMSLTTGVSLRADVGSGAAVTLLEIAQLLADLSDSRAPFTSAEFRLGDVRAAFADLTEAKKELDFTPSCSIEDGLEGLLSWVETEVAR